MMIGRSGRSVLFRVTMILATTILVLMVGGALYGAMWEADPMEPPAPEDLTRQLAPQELLEDIDVLVRTIEEVHIDPYARTSAADFHRAIAELRDGIREPRGRRTLYGMLAPVVAALGDGHTSVRLPVEEINRVVRDGGVWFPLAVSLGDGGATVVADYTPDSAIAPGAALVAINGVPVGDVLDRLTGLVSSAQRAHRLATVEAYFPFYLWLAYGWDDDFAIVYRPVDETGLVERRAAGLPYREIQRRRAGGDAGRSDGPFALRLDSATGTGVLTVTRFADRQAFADFLDDAFAQIEAQGLDRLVVDLRENGGGSTDVSAVLLRYLAREPFRHFARYDLKVSRPIKHQLKRQLPAAVRWLPLQYLFARGRAIWGVPEGRTITVDGAFVAPHDGPRRFGGEVLVLVGPATFSAAADFAAVVQDFGLGTLVGEATGGLACSFGDAHAFRLPNSRLEVGVSYKYFVRPSGECGEGGVQPEHLVVGTAADVAAGRDPVMEYALALPR